jgi:hypothetical protein
MELVKQVGLKYDFKQSQRNAGDLSRKWVTPRIENVACEKALRQLLDPLGLSYEAVDDKVVLKRKQ